jgi:hypothetical protein
MPNVIPVLYGAIVTLPSLILPTLGTRTEDATPTLATGDVQINKDNGGWVNVTNLPTTGASPVVLILTAAESTCKSAIIRFKDQTSPAEWDQVFIDISTYGNASAFDIRLAGTDGKSLVSTDAQDLSSTLSVNTKTFTAGAITDAAFAAATYPKALRTATAQSGAAGYIQLDASAGATDNTWIGCGIKIVSGTGVGQARTIIHYVGSTQKAYVDRVWATNPAVDSVFVIQLGKLTVDIQVTGLAQAGAAYTITLPASAVATVNYYDGSIVSIISGTGVGQARIISSYAASQIATVSEPWSVTPDTTSVCIVRGLGEINIGAILGTAISTPVTAGILDVNIKNMNNVAATSITAVNANQGTTQPINFTGTGASALTKADLIDIASAAVNTALAQLGVNVVTQANIDFGDLQKASLNAATPDSVTGSVNSVTNDVGITQSAADKVWGSTVSLGATLLTNLRAMVWDELLSVSRTALSFGSKIKNWVLSSVDNKVLISTDVQDLSATLSINTKAIAGSVTAATNLASSANTISNGTVDNTAFTATTTELESNNITDSETNLHKGRSIVFKTGHLAKEYANITAYSLVSGRGHFTYTLLSSAPSNADTFEVF